MGLTEAEQVANLLHIRTIHQGLVYQVAFLLLCFLSQNVTVVSVMSFDLTGSGETESLLCAGICLYFWHFFVCFKLLFIVRWQRIYRALRTLLLFIRQRSLSAFSVHRHHF